MGRHAEGWVLRQPGGPNTTYYVRFSHAGRRREISTGTADPDRAATEAATRYAEVVSGRRAPRAVTTGLDQLVAAWLVEYEKDHAAGTAETVTMYARAHWLPFFGDLSRITKEGAGDYGRHRLTQATRSTVRKELSALRRFAGWAGLDVEIPGLPSHGHPGRRAKNARKERATILSPEQMERLLAVLPVRGVRHGHPVRAFFRLLYETGLRESTLFSIDAPKHFRKGARAMLITRDIDKAHDEREIPLSPAAVKALTKCVPDVGRIFQVFSLRDPLRAACEALTKENPTKPFPLVSSYDLRHSRLTAWANMPHVPLPGVSYLAGHKSLATTARYVQGQRHAADAVILGGIVGVRKAKKKASLARASRNT